MSWVVTNVGYFPLVLSPKKGKNPHFLDQPKDFTVWLAQISHGKFTEQQRIFSLQLSSCSLLEARYLSNSKRLQSNFSSDVKKTLMTLFTATMSANKT